MSMLIEYARGAGYTYGRVPHLMNFRICSALDSDHHLYKYLQHYQGASEGCSSFQFGIFPRNPVIAFAGRGVAMLFQSVCASPRTHYKLSTIRTAVKRSEEGEAW